MQHTGLWLAVYRFMDDPYITSRCRQGVWDSDANLANEAGAKMKCMPMRIDLSAKPSANPLRGRVRAASQEFHSSETAHAARWLIAFEPGRCF